MTKSLEDQLTELRAIHQKFLRLYTGKCMSMDELQNQYNQLKLEFEKMGKPNSHEDRITKLEGAVKKLFSELGAARGEIAILKAKAGIVTVTENKPPASTPAPLPVPVKPTSPTPMLDAIPEVPAETASPA